MYVIIPVSDMETSFLPLSEPLCKALIPVGKKPILQHILDELYSYQSFVDEIVIVKNDCFDIQEYLKCNKQDDFFMTKIHCVKGKNYKQPLNAKYSIFDDFYTGMEYLVDELRVCPSEVLLWSGDELILNSQRLSDQTLSSFVCSVNGKSVKVCRLNEFAHVVNSVLHLKQDLNPHTLEDFLKLYSSCDELEAREDFGDYKKWDDTVSYYNLQTEFLEQDEHETILLEIDASKDIITKTNRYADIPYSYETSEISRMTQWNLWSEANFLSSADEEQAVFLPKFIEQGVNKRGDYCDTITEEMIYGNSLSDLLLNAQVSKDNWKVILEKVISVNKEIFHKDSLEDEDELYHSYVPKNKREEYIEFFATSLNNNLYTLTQRFSEENEQYNYYVMKNNDIAEWKMFFDRFLEKYSSHITKDTFIYNGSCGRLVHNNLFFENIIYDTFTNKMKFISPRSRSWQFVEKLKDYARMYACVIGLDALLGNKYFTDDKGNICISDRVRATMKDCEEIMDDILGDMSAFLKDYAIIILMEEAAKADINTSRVILKYASQLKSSKLFKYRS